MTTSHSSRFATKLANFVIYLLPPNLKDWGEAMRSEVDAISAPDKATQFAIGCLFFAIRQRIAFSNTWAFKCLVKHPRIMVAICVVLATGLGLVHMILAQAPMSYLAMNVGALVLGFLIVGIATMSAKIFNPRWGLISLILASVIIATSLFGSSAEGATRWIMLGGLSVQSSLLIVPTLAIVFARHQSGFTTLAIILTSVGLAMQPDRGMSGALAAAMLVSALANPTKTGVVTASAAMGGFVVALLQSDNLPAAQYVDQIYSSSFAFHPIAGLAVWAGTLLLLLPAIIGILRGGLERNTYLVFGTVWGATCLAAGLGNYPTPVVGYGGSAIIGYVVCMLGFAAPVRRAPRIWKTPTNRHGQPKQTPDLCVTLA